MAKVKIPRKSTAIDMTAMCDVAFLLLTFFMLTTKFRPDEPVIVDTPSSISETKLEETKVAQITIDREGRVFFGIDNQETRKQLLKNFGDIRGMTFDDQEVARFSLVGNFCLPAAQLKEFLDTPPTERANFHQPGIPIDTTNNELDAWLLAGVQADGDMMHQRLTLKGDRDATYPTVKRVFDILRDRRLSKIHFVTNLEADPNKASSAPEPVH
jgi:biopolymer transport protein ExbD